MPESATTPFIVLRTTQVSESKLVANGLTPSGRMAFIGYGAVGSGKRGGLELGLFRLLAITYIPSDKELQRYQNIELEADYGAVSRHYPRYAAACWLAQFTLANFQPNLPCPFFFEALKQGLERLATRQDIPAEAVLLGVILVYLREGGWMGEYEEEPQAARQIQTLLEMALGKEPPSLKQENWHQLLQWGLTLLQLHDEAVIPSGLGALSSSP